MFLRPLYINLRNTLSDEPLLEQELYGPFSRTSFASDPRYPGGHGVGDLGAHAYAWVDFLVAAKQGLWQVLPLGPTGYGDLTVSEF